MRILHISTRLILGGSQENTVLSCEGQARLGHDVHLAYGPIYGPEGSLLERVKQRNDACRMLTTSFVEAFADQGIKARQIGGARPIHLHEIPNLVREVHPIRDRRALCELLDLVRYIKPDIVHTHSSKAGVLGRASAWRAIDGGSPAIVHTIHGPPFMPIEGGVVSRARIRLKNWMYARAERYAATRCHVTVSVADAMTREFLERGIGRPEQYVTVRSGMEVEPFLTPAPGDSRDEARAGLGLGDGDFVVGTVARLAEHKGHDDLLDALGEEMRRDRRIRLLWVGDGWWRQRLVERARALDLGVAELDGGSSAIGSRLASSRQIILTGLVPPDRIPGLIRSMDVLAHPSYREGLPRTVPQALLCGVCPVAYDCDGTREVCREMQTGRLVRTGDRGALREATLWLMNNPRERAAMAARGREECRVAFSAETMVAELEKVYARAIEIARAK